MFWAWWGRGFFTKITDNTAMPLHLGSSKNISGPWAQEPLCVVFFCIKYYTVWFYGTVKKYLPWKGG